MLEGCQGFYWNVKVIWAVHCIPYAQGLIIEGIIGMIIDDIPYRLLELWRLICLDLLTLN